jgi:hypothetical protein
MPLTTAGKNNLISVTSYTHAGAYTDLGATEVSGGSYARQAITWAASSGGARSSSATLTIPIPSGVTVQSVGVWDASTAGVSQGFFAIGSASQLLKGVGTVAATGDLITSYAHGLVADDRVFLTPVAGEALPAGLSATTAYFVRATGLTADAFSLSLTSGGAAVDVTANGELAWHRTVPQSFPSGGNLVINAGTLTIDVNAFG